MPAGRFAAQDGRPKECGAWLLDDAAAARIVAQVEARKTPLCIDYDHQSLTAAKTGVIAPAAGWFRRVEWRPGAGLYAVDVEWNDRASTMIAAREFCFISPVFTYDKQGRPDQLINAALTNNPAVDGMDEVRLAALSQALGLSSTPSLQETSDMDELIEQLRWLLNLPVGATADDIKAQLQKLINQLSDGQGVAAAAVDLSALLTDRDTQIAALTANQADPARFVPIEVMVALQGQIAELTAASAGNEVDELVTAALTDGRLLPAQEGWARSLGGSDIAQLRNFLDSAPRIAALSSTQTGGRQPTTAPAGELDEATLTASDCAVLGPTLAPVPIIITGLVLDGTTLDSATPEINTRLAAYFATLVPGGTAYRNKIASMISDIQGVVDFVLASPATNVTSAVDATHVQLLTLGGVAIS